jgi:glucokinase
MVYLSLGSGLGAGALVDGKLINGTNRSALEVGHLALSGLTLPCACGNTGCAETILSGPGLVRTFLHRDWKPELTSPLTVHKDITAQDILKAAEQGDKRASMVLIDLGCYLGEICADITMILNPSLIIIGGGLGLAAYEFVINPARREIKKRTLAQNYRCLSVKKSELNSSALGAAALVRHCRPVLLPQRDERR